MTRPATDQEDVAACINEVILLHEYLEAWLKGDIGKSGSQPLRLADSLSNDFIVIHPTGALESRNAVIANFESAWGSRPSGYSMQISDIHHVLESGTLHLMSYIETHLDPEPARRRSTAILEISEGRTAKWHYLHETLMQ